MHLGSALISARQVLWTLTFAAELVLLVVLLGRDRARRYPWFTAMIVLLALRQMTEMLLLGRMPAFAYDAISITMADLVALMGLLVFFELGRRAFGDARLRSRLLGGAAMAAVAAGVLAAWGPWLTWTQLTPNPKLAVKTLNLMLVVATPADNLWVRAGLDKGNLLVCLLTAQLGLLVLLLGRRFKAGWRSHTQQIALGLSTVAIAWLAVQGIWQIIAKTAQIHTRQDYDRVMDLSGKMVNANKVVYLAALVWWIVWLWFDEPGNALAEEAPAEATQAVPDPPAVLAQDPLPNEHP